MIIATAGHVDHGKTSVVRTLTGIDTDRLKEEKARGLTIEVGFAYTNLNDQRIGFVDVPGHRRFISNMLAGVASIDFALLIIAADDGPMPQTVEHLEILQMLQVQNGAIVLTKCDLVSDARIEEVQADIRRLTENTFLDQAFIWPVSSATGAGIEALKTGLATASAKIRRQAQHGYFRMGIDRSFAVKGAGQVVTGSVLSGTLSTGQAIRVLPAAETLRIREMHTQDTVTQEAVSGDRCAINLGGYRSPPQRGQWLTSNPELTGSDRFAATLTISKHRTRALRHWTPVHFHCGVNHVTGRVAILESARLEPEQQGYVQIALDEPVPLIHGDHFIIRDQGAEETLGGGKVLLPMDEARGRTQPARIARLKVLNSDDALAVRIADFAEQFPQGIPTALLVSSFNLPAQVLQRELGQAFNIDDIWCISTHNFEKCQQLVTRTLTDWQAANPQESGVTPQQLRRACKINEVVFSQVTDQLAASGALKISGNRIVPAGHSAQLSGPAASLWKRTEPLLRADPLRPPVLHDLSRTLGLPPRATEKLLGQVVGAGLLVKPVANRFFLPEAIESLKDTIRELCAASPNGSFTVIEFRDRTNLGRNLCIELLEYFDGRGFTVRQENVRKLQATRRT